MLQVFYSLRRWAGWIAIAAVAVALAYWGFVYSSKPKIIRIATASQGGYYYAFGSLLKKYIEKQTPYSVQVLVTRGSVDNRAKLLADQADLAILQTSAVSLHNLAGVAPLWDDYVQIVVRKNSDIKSIKDLPGHNIAIGKMGSGYRANAMNVLDYYGIDPKKLGHNTDYFLKMMEDDTLDGAIVTTGLVNPDLRKLVASGRVRFLPIPGTQGFTFNHTYYRENSIPEGVYPSSGAPLPAKPTSTVTTDAILAARTDASSDMIQAILPVLYSIDLRAEAPSLVQRNPMKDPIWRLLPIHPATKSYFNPYAGLGVFAQLLGELAKFKEVLILLIIGAFFVRYQWKQSRRARGEQRTKALSRQLEKLFEDLVGIEQAQKEAKDIRLLQEHLTQAGYIKSKALKITLGTPIENTSLFIAFLQQASSLIREIEWRLSLAATTSAGPRSVDNGKNDRRAAG